MGLFGSSDDRAKVHDKAQQLASKGKVARAVAMLEEFLASHPDDDRTLLKLADLHRRDGDAGAAVEAFRKAADLYLARGFSLKAAASLRQAEMLAPGDVVLVEGLAELNAKLGLARDAARGLEQLAAAAAQAGDRARLLALRRRISALLPDDAGATVRLADLLAEDGRRDDAVRLLEEAARARQDPAHQEVWTLLQERLCALQPGDAGRATALARTLLDRSAPKRAIAILKPVFSADRSNVEALRLLAEAFSAIGHASKAGAAWREIARAHHRAGRAAELKAAWSKVLELLPGDAEAERALTPPPRARGPEVRLKEALAEADFLAEHGAPEEARDVLLRLQALHPESRPIAERLEALDEEEVVDVEELIEEEELVTEEEERDSTTMILDRVPPERIPRVAEGALHRDLAIAFMEMQLHDEALAELEKAIADDPPRESACLALAGRCHLARGAPKDAVSAYRRALASPLLSFEGAAAVHYELGEALASLGEKRDALEHFREANRLEPGFREVAKRLRALGG